MPPVGPNDRPYGVLPQTASQWAYLKDMQAWIKNPSISMYGRWNHPPPTGCPNCPGEGGVDLTSLPGTPVYALGTGPMLSAATFQSVGEAHPGAVLTQRVNVPGAGPQDIYYQHIDLSPAYAQCLGGNCGGRIIQAGERIGTTSSVGEIEIGFNPNWGSLYGPSNHPGPWPSDPRPWIKALMTQNPSNVNIGGTVTNPPVPPGTGCSPWDIGCIWTNLQGGLVNIGEHIAIFLIGLVMVILGFYLLAEKQVNAVAKKAGEVAAL